VLSAGQRHANLQVKTSSKKVGLFPMPPVEEIRAGEHDWYVLLRWIKQEQRFKGFMLSGEEAKAEVARDRQSQAKSIEEGPRKKFFPAIPVSESRVRARADAWRAGSGTPGCRRDARSVRTRRHR